MPLNLLAIDVGKYSFHIFGIDEDGLVIPRKVSRAKLVDTVDRPDPKIVAMEACGNAHHWGRLFQAAGRTVLRQALQARLQKRCTDAQAIFEAADRPTMRFVPVKTLECQDLQALHRVGDRLVSQGATRFTALVSQAIDGAALSELTRELSFDLVDQLNDVIVGFARSMHTLLQSAARTKRAAALWDAWGWTYRGQSTGRGNR